jgi:hypothetical protein
LEGLGEAARVCCCRNPVNWKEEHLKAFSQRYG